MVGKDEAEDLTQEWKEIGLNKLLFKPFDLDYYKDNNGKVESFFYYGRLLGFQTVSGEMFGVNFIRRCDVLKEDFNIFKDFIIPSGTYWWSNFNVRFNTNPGRMVSGNFYYSRGEYYSGLMQTIQFSIMLRINKNITVASEYTNNAIELSVGKFNTYEFWNYIQYGYSPKLNCYLFTQWNNDINEIDFNFRLHWIPKIDSDIYFVINKIYNSSATRIKPAASILLLKISYGIEYLF